MSYRISSDCGFSTRFRARWFWHRHVCEVCS